LNKRFGSITLGLALIFSMRAGMAAPAGYDPTNLDRTAPPGKDFYQFAVGGWRAAHPIPPEYPEWDASSELEESNRAKLHDLLEADVSADAGGETRQLGDYYSSGMDADAINRAGFEPIKADLDRIEAVNSLADLEKVVAAVHRDEINAFFSFGPDQDARNSGMNLAEINQDGLGLPDRDYYIKTDAKTQAIQRAYRKHVTQTFVLLGETPDVASQHADTVYQYERQIALRSRNNVDLRDPVKNYHRMTLADLEKLAPSFPWSTYLADTGCPSDTPINVSQPEFVRALEQIWTTQPLADTRTYLRWQLVNGVAPWLSDAFVDEDFSFHGKTLKGLQALQPRWKRVLHTIDDTMGEALGKQYVAKWFPPTARAQALSMVQNLKAVLREDLKTLPWMSAATRQKAIEKLDAMHEKIGYPDKWRDYSGLHIDKTSYAGNVLRARQFDFAFHIAQINHPVDRSLWDMTPPTVNAYYNPAMNEIVFPAGILQPPFFDPQQDDALNYGNTGATIGHEMTHGFDDQGCLYDAQGNLKNWWTRQDMAHFQARTVAIQRLFDSYQIGDGLHGNGKLESGEAIADLGGLKIAYRAYEKSLQGKPRTVDANGFTPEQRFFLAYALSWACNDRPEYERLMMLTNPHPLEQFRVRGTVSNLPEFAQAWHLKPSDPMVLPPDKRTEIW
jgi:putative endopeptidase